MTATFWQRLRCRLGGHETPEPWEAPRASYARKAVIGRQDGITYYRQEYRCTRCGRWFSYRGSDVLTSLWEPPQKVRA